ncbi:MAG: hypothetical protein HY517_01000 [Candidatus Aenigmarchaeota archaeon]|nr:hypothetical protein [Candidatus Aenigmarchaeota archaeon]
MTAVEGLTLAEHRYLDTALRMLKAQIRRAAGKPAPISADISVYKTAGEIIYERIDDEVSRVAWINRGVPSLSQKMLFSLAYNYVRSGGASFDDYFLRLSEPMRAGFLNQLEAERRSDPP